MLKMKENTMQKISNALSVVNQLEVLIWKAFVFLIETRSNEFSPTGKWLIFPITYYINDDRCDEQIINLSGNWLMLF